VRKLVRPRSDRWFGGVAAGLGAYFDISPTIYRIAFAALALAGGTGGLLYLAAWLIIPDEDDVESIAERTLRDHRDQPVLVAGLGVLAVIFIVAVSHVGFWPNPNNFWLVALIAAGAGAWWIWQSGQADDDAGDVMVSSVEFHGTPTKSAPATVAAASATASPTGVAPDIATTPAARAEARKRRHRHRKPSLFLPVVGVLLSWAGTLALLDLLDITTIDWRIAFAGALLVIGVGVVAGVIFGRSVAGLVGLGFWAGAALFLTMSVPLQGGIGSRVEQPANTAELSHSYRLAIGELELDLASLQLPAGDTHVDASVGVGRLLITVPADVDVEVDGHAGSGDLDLLGQSKSGFSIDRTVRDTPAASPGRRLVLDAGVGVGQVEVRRK
jgi:phage shock protein PspC (stress-responsive transcriptional regulator)